MKRLILEIRKVDFDHLVEYRDKMNQEQNIDFTVEQAAADCIIRKTREYLNKKKGRE